MGRASRSLCVMLGLVGLVSVVGCARISIRTGKAVVPTNIERGKTTRADILDRFGPPQVVDDTRGAVFGPNFLVYEERRSDGWHGLLYPPLIVLRDLPIIGISSCEEHATSTIFLFDDQGNVVDWATTDGPVGRRFGWSFLCAVYTKTIFK